MPRKCSVSDCHSSSGFKFPRNPRILKLWKRALNISKTKQLNERCIVCLKHFTPDDFAKISKYTNCELIRKQLNKDAVPSLLLPKQDDTLYGEISDEEVEQITDIKPIIVKTTSDNVMENHEIENDSGHRNISSILSASDFLEVNTSTNAYDHFLASEIFSNVSQNFALNEIQSISANNASSQEPSVPPVLKQQFGGCSIQNNQNNKPATRSLSTQTTESKSKSIAVQTFRNGSLSFDFIKTKKGGITYFTGLKSSQVFELILQKLGPSPSTLIYKYHNVNNMSVEDQLMITLVKLRKVSPDFELSVLFDTCNKSIQNIFTSWINFMFNQLIKRQELWPSKDVYDFFASNRFDENYTILQNTQLFGASLQSEEKSSQKLSEIQKVINLAKFTYKILKNPLAKYYTSIGSRIFTACCFLANFKFENIVIPEEVIIKTEDFSE